MVKRLSEKQIVAVEYLALPQRGGLTYTEIADNVGVTERQLYNWRQDDDFMDAVVKRTIRNAAEYLPDIMASVPKHIIEDGNAAMLRTYMQSIGALTEKLEIDSKGSVSEDVDKMREKVEKFRKQNGNDGS